MARRFLVFLLLVTVCSQANAWGPRGHRFVGELAAAGLDPAVAAEIERLLQGEPEPTLAGIANWADTLRDQDPDLGRRTASWHYVNIADNGCSYIASRDCPDGNCIIEAIHAQSERLADRSLSIEERLEALKFVVHFVGDIHQPMHAGYSHDRGGNRVQVTVVEANRRTGTNLHALWDSGLFRGAERRSAHLHRLKTLPQDSDVSGSVVDWARESCEIVLTPGIYPERAVLADNYVTIWRPVAEQQIIDAGARLAALLNRILAGAQTQ